MEFTANDNPEVAEKESFRAEFWVSFNEKQTTVAACLEDPNATPETLVAAKRQITELQDFVTAAAIDLPKYDLRRSQEVM
jgi:hypothetical protein